MPSLEEFTGAFFSIVQEVGAVVFHSHVNMDPDAIGSIIGLQELLRQHFPSSLHIKVHQTKVSRLSRVFMNALGVDVDFIDAPSMTIPHVPVIVDSQRLPPCADDTRVVIIDHHEDKGNSRPGDVVLVDCNAQSNCELVYGLWVASGHTLTPVAAKAMAGGIIFDSAFLRNASRQTITILSNLVNAGADYNEIRNVLTEKMPYSERVARLKACTRATLVKLDPWVLAWSEVSSFEASACRALIQAGADASIVLAGNTNEVRLSARQNDAFFQAFHVNLATIMESVAPIIEGSGGGHQMAAAANGVKNGKDALDKAIKTIVDTVKTSSR